MHRASTVSQGIDVVYSLAGGSDYQEINAVDLNYLIFDNANRRQSFNVAIMDDQSEEATERFSLELRFDPFEISPPSDVLLRPNASVITILDDDPSGMKVATNAAHKPVKVAAEIFVVVNLISTVFYTL